MPNATIRRANLGKFFANRTLPEREKSYISQLLSGKASFGEKAARRLEVDYGMPSGYLDNAGTPNVQEIPSDKKVPLIDFVQAGSWGSVQDPYPVGGAEEWIACPVKHSAGTFALRVSGDSMYNPGGTPSFSDGDIIFVDPEKEARHRSLVIARTGDGEAIFKRLLVDGYLRKLEALNPAWPQRIQDLEVSALICGVVIAKMESFS